MTKTNSFRDLIVWQKAHQLVLSVYTVTKKFPKEEVYGLTNQVRRSSSSVAANLAEGYKTKTVPNKLKYIGISEGSLEETKYHLILSKYLMYIEEAVFNELIATAEEVGKLLNGYEKFVSRQKIR
ncbi:MAG: four helix bundle protein [Bacteroidetes bacterium]|nr:four helix bundle protein [Bacteroidota bacterium]